MPESKSFAIQQSYHFEAPPERVFRALTDPKLLEKWFLSKARLVPKKGGAYSFNWIGGYHMTGNVKRFEPSKAVSFSWTDKIKNGKLAKTTASFQVTRQGDGSLLKLRHTGFKDPEHFADCSSKMGILSDQHEIGLGPQNRSPFKVRLVDSRQIPLEDELHKIPVHSRSLPGVDKFRLHFEDYLFHLV